MKSILIDGENSESGKLTVLAMVFCIVGITAYLKVGRFILPKLVPQPQLTLLLLVLGTITLFTLGGVIHTILLGEKSPRQLRKEIKKQLKELSGFISHIKAHIEEVESQIGYRAGLFRPGAYDQLNQLRQLTFGLERRVTEVEFLVATRKRSLLYRAAQLLGSDLRTVESCLDQLIDARPLPALSSDSWIPTAERLLAAVEDEARRAQSLRAA